MKSERTARLLVPRDEINRIELIRAVEAAHPLLLCGFGFLLIAIGLLSLPVILGWLDRGGGASWKVFALPTAILLGAWMVYDALKRVPLLRLDTIRGTRKLVFQSRASREELIEFVRQAEARFGYSIEIRI